MRSKKSLIFWTLVSVIPLIGIVWNISDPAAYEASRDEWSARITQFGVWGPVAFVLLQIVQVIITPINHYVVGVLGGFLYGPILGGALNWLGRVIGHIAAFALARTLGRKIVNRFVPEEDRRRYDRLVGNKGLVLFLLFFLPFFPDDELSYLVGLGGMRWRIYLPAVIFGHIGGSWTLSYVGAGVKAYDPFFWALVGFTIIGFVLIALLMRRDSKAPSEAGVENE